ncbi:phosphatase PAP2 family protein [Terriglobus sp. ADX1]|uniref:phosphatase PAP2 family protein n=1 Tax=Terriglobus sp. ADX1 TaxID=2794063 RepID=UPI002FE5F64E
MVATRIFVAALAVLATTVTASSQAPSETVLRGLSTVTVLSRTASGRAALSSNLTVTSGIQTGAIPQPTLLPDGEQRGQSLRDADVTSANASQLADALGTALGAAYVARAHSIDREHYTVAAESITRVLRLATGTSGPHSNEGKYLFGNGTTNGTTPVSAEWMKIITSQSGEMDPFGRAYHFPAGAPNADRYGDSRPFQTAPELRRFTGRDSFNMLIDNTQYLRGPAMDLTNSPSYPSGHTTFGYTATLILGLLVPERYPQMIARGAEYGNSRILIGAHYAMDVLGGRTLALYDTAHLLAEDPAYKNAAGFRKAMEQAKADMTKVLESACGKTVAECAKEDTSRFSDPAAVSAFYAVTQTYGLPVVFAKTAASKEDVATVAPEAGYLLTVAYPSLTLKQADDILTETEGPGGGFLDDGSAFGLYSRINLYEAAMRAQQIAANR